MTASNEQAPTTAAKPPTLFADPLIPIASCQLVAQGAEAVSESCVKFERVLKRERQLPHLGCQTKNEKKPPLSPTPPPRPQTKQKLARLVHRVLPRPPRHHQAALLEKVQAPDPRPPPDARARPRRGACRRAGEETGSSLSRALSRRRRGVDDRDGEAEGKIPEGRAAGPAAGGERHERKQREASARHAGRQKADAESGKAKKKPKDPSCRACQGQHRAHTCM